MAVPEGVALVLAPNPSLMTGPGTNSYIVWGTAGPCVVVDPGPEIPSHLARLAEVGAEHGGIGTILITHGHPDHVEGAAKLRELVGAPILAWSREGTPVADETIADNATIPVGTRHLRAIHTPGHRFDHLCFLLEDARALFAGDLVAGVGTVVIAPPEGNLGDYLASLRRLLPLDLLVILPGHGPDIDQPRTLLEGYIAHREERTRQVLAGLAAGPVTVPTLVAGIYADVNPALHPAAAYSVLAHLEQLEREGRVRHEDQPNGSALWMLTERN